MRESAHGGIFRSTYQPEFITDLDKLNLVILVYGGLILGSSRFFLLPQLPQKIQLATKVVKSDSKIIILLR